MEAFLGLLDCDSLFSKKSLWSVLLHHEFLHSRDEKYDVFFSYSQINLAFYILHNVVALLMLVVESGSQMDFCLPGNFTNGSRWSEESEIG